MTRKQQVVMFDGAKAVTLWGDDGWTQLSGAVEVPDTSEWLAARVAVMFRGTKLVADAVASIPFDILDESGDVVDTSDDYKNVVGFMPQPADMFWRIEDNWINWGSAYIYRNANNAGYIKVFNPLAPSSVRFDPENNKALPFIRTVSNEKKRFAVSMNALDEYTPGEAIAPIWYPDGNVEFGPPLRYPAKAAYSAMGVLYNLDNAATRFFQRGMMGISIFSVPAGTASTEKDKMESKVNNLLTGVKQAWKSIWMNGELKVTPVGGGLSELANVPLTEQEWTNVSMALGVPMTKLRSESAAGLGGGGVASSDDVRIITDTALPDFCKIIEQLNRQIFAPNGYRIVERHERMSMFQQNEATRTAAMTSLVSAFQINAELARIFAKVTGVSIAEEQQAQIDAIIARNNAPEPTPTQSPAPVEQPVKAAWSDDLERWKRKALKSVGKPVTFESDVIPTDLHDIIASGLSECKTAEDVRGLFSQTQQPDLAAELRRANDLLEAVKNA
jgi:hypothetical protein